MNSRVSNPDRQPLNVGEHAVDSIIPEAANPAVSSQYAETIDSMEVTVKYTMGKVLWYLGLLWNNDGGAKIAKEWADFTVAGSETTAIYMRGKVAL